SRNSVDNGKWKFNFSAMAQYPSLDFGLPVRIRPSWKACSESRKTLADFGGKHSDFGGKQSDSAGTRPTFGGEHSAKAGRRPEIAGAHPTTVEVHPAFGGGF